MITIRRYTPQDAPLWDSFVCNSKNGTFMLQRGFMDYHAERFVDFSLFFWDDAKLIALLPLNLKDNRVFSHGGLTYGGLIFGAKTKQKKVLECFATLVNFLKENGISELYYKKIPAIYTAQPADEDLYALWANGGKLLKMEASSAVFLPELLVASELKRRIARGARENVIFEESTNFEEFCALLAEVLKKRHSANPVHSAAELKLLHARFPQNIALFVAKIAGKMAAGALLFIYPQLVHTQYLAANDAARQKGALDLVISTLITKFQKEKRYFDFGISTENDGKFLNEGLIAQKEGFGARTVNYETWVLEIFWKIHGEREFFWKFFTVDRGKN